MGTFPYGIISQTTLLTGDSVSSYVNMNTLFGAVVVLGIIVFIMITTYFVSIKPNLTDRSSGNNTNDKVSVDPVISRIAEKEEDLISDCELVAVITAAIYASMGDAVPAGGLVVRSIRKSGSRKWMNA